MTEELPGEGAPPDACSAAAPPAADTPEPAQPIARTKTAQSATAQTATAQSTTAQAAASHAPAAVQTLKQAMRRARLDDAERAGAIADLRAARIGRLELLEEALKPLAAQIPEDIDLFDFGLVPTAHPRLFIDMIGFVEMGRDARRYHFIQDTRYGRVSLADSESVETMVDAITNYVARRLLERDKALAADAADGIASPPAASTYETPRPRARQEPRRRRSTVRRVAGAGFAFLIDLLGSIAFFTILAAIGWVAWSHLYGAG